MMSQINDKGNRSETEKTEDQPERRVRVTERDILKPEHFKIAATKALSQPTDLKTRICESSAHNKKVTKALAVLKKKGPCKLINGAPGWKEVNGLIYYKGKLYIPNDKDIRAEIVKSCHNLPTAGHLGKNGMLELVQCHY
jgi:hypothetical protein